jgi:hypothetical protein
MLALTTVLLLSTYAVPVSAAENSAVVDTAVSAQTNAHLMEKHKNLCAVNFLFRQTDFGINIYFSR